MAFRYRLQKILEFRILKKEEQLLVVLRAQAEVDRIEQLIQQNKIEIGQTRANMRKADHTLIEAYDKYLKHLYDKEDSLIEEKKHALEILKIETDKLIELEKAVKILEKHKERLHEAYKDEEKKTELKTLSEIGVQRHFAQTLEKLEEGEAELLEEIMQEMEGLNINEY